MNNKIYIIGPITEEGYLRFSKQLDAITANSADSVTIEICSSGGSSAAGLAYFGKIRSCPNKTIAVIHGVCQSAATLIVSACDYRTASNEVIFMVHDSQHKFKGDLTDMLKEAEDMLFDERHWTNLLSQRTSLSVKVLRSMHKRTTYFNANDALEYGLIHQILPPKGAE